MKQFIEPITSWSQNGIVTLNTLNVNIVHDNCTDTCTVYYEVGFTEMVTQGGETVEKYVTTVPPVTGNVTIESADYANWDNSNTQLMAMVAAKLNLTLIEE